MSRDARRGASALETAFALPFLVLLPTAGADFGYLGLVEHQLGHAARSASRFGITGTADTPPPTAAARVAWCDAAPPADNPRLDRIRAIIAATTAGVLKAPGLCLTMRSYGGYQSVGQPEPLADINGNGRHDAGEAFTDVNGNGQWDSDQGASSAGGGDEVAVYTLRYRTHPLTGLTPGLPASRMLAFQARLVVRNEPF